MTMVSPMERFLCTLVQNNRLETYKVVHDNAGTHIVGDFSLTCNTNNTPPVRDTRWNNSSPSVEKKVKQAPMIPKPKVHYSRDDTDLPSGSVSRWGDHCTIMYEHSLSPPVRHKVLGLDFSDHSLKPTMLVPRTRSLPIEILSPMRDTFIIDTNTPISSIIEGISPLE